MNEKQRIAEQAAQRVSSGMLIGLGTGSTANLFIEALAQRVKTDALHIKTVPSSVISSIKARECGLSVEAIETIDYLDVYVDGADEVAPELTLLKGRGSDLVREKLLAQASREFWVLADSSKRVSRIGERYPIPIEVMPFAWRLVKASVESLGGTGYLRPNAANDGLHVTSYGSLVLDMVFDPMLDVKQLADALSAIPGVVEHGIFTGLATDSING